MISDNLLSVNETSKIDSRNYALRLGSGVLLVLGGNTVVNVSSNTMTVANSNAVAGSQSIRTSILLIEATVNAQSTVLGEGFFIIGANADHYSAISDAHSSMDTKGIPTILVSANTVSVIAMRIMIGNNFQGSSFNGHSLVALTGAKFIASATASSFNVQDNVMLVSGIAGSAYPDTVVVMTLRQSTVEGPLRLLIARNTINTAGTHGLNGGAPLITYFAPRIFYSIESFRFYISNGSVVVANNSIIAWRVTLLNGFTAESPQIGVMPLDWFVLNRSSLVFSGNYFEYSIMERPLEVVLTDPLNTSHYRSFSGTSVTSLIVQTGFMSFDESEIVINDNAIRVREKAHSGARLIWASVGGLSAVNSPGNDLFVCNNTVNGYGRPFSDLRVTMGDYRAFIARVQTADLVYHLCQAMLDDRTWSVTPSLTLRPSATSSVMNASATPARAPITQTIVATRTVPLNTTAAPLVPVPAVEVAAQQVKDVASVVVVVSAVSSATGGQLGVANAMLRLTDCTANGEEDGPLPVLVHPLRFSFGSKSYQKHAAGAVSNTILVPLIVAIISLGPVRWLIMYARGVSSQAAITQMGWPTLLIMPFANLAEGIGVTALTAIMSSEAFGVVMGLIALAILLTFTGSWVWVLLRVIPESRLELRAEEGREGLGKHRAFLWRMVRPSHRWVPGKEDDRPLSFAFVERYSNAVGEKKWFYAEVLCFMCSIIVGVAESLPPTACKARVVMAVVPAVAQCLLSTLSVIPLERFLQSALGICLVPMYGLVLAKVFLGAEANSDLLDSVMAVLSSAGNIIGIFIMALGLIVGLWEMATGANTKRRIRRPSIPIICRNPHHDDLCTPMIASSSEDDLGDPTTHAPAREVGGEMEMEMEMEALDVDPLLFTTTSRMGKGNSFALIPERTVEEVLDYVEQAALMRLLSDEF